MSMWTLVTEVSSSLAKNLDEAAGVQTQKGVVGMPLAQQFEQQQQQQEHNSSHSEDEAESHESHSKHDDDDDGHSQHSHDEHDEGKDEFEQPQLESRGKAASDEKINGSAALKQRSGSHADATTEEMNEKAKNAHSVGEENEGSDAGLSKRGATDGNVSSDSLDPSAAVSTDVAATDAAPALDGLLVDPSQASFSSSSRAQHEKSLGEKPNQKKSQGTTGGVSTSSSSSSGKKAKAKAESKHGSSTREVQPSSRQQQQQQQQVFVVADDGIQKRLAALQEEGRELSLQLGRERERGRATLAENRRLQDKLTALEADSTAASAREEHLKQLLADAEERQKTLKAEKRDLQLQVAELGSELAGKAEDLGQAAEGHHALKETISDLEEKLQSIIDVKRAECSELEARLGSELEQLQALLRSTQHDCEKKIEALEADVASALERANAAETRNVELSKNASESTVVLQQQLLGYEGSMKTLEAAVQKKDTDLAAAKRRYDVVQESLLKAEMRVKEVEGSYSRMKRRLEDELAAATGDCQRSNSRLLVLEGNLREANDKATKAWAQAEREAARHGEAYAELEKELREAKHAAAGVGGHRRGSTAANMEHGGDHHVDPGASSSSSVGAGGTGAKPAAKLETDLLRAYAEISQLKERAAASAGAAERLSQLVEQHDMLLQMFGQKEEELEDMTEMNKQLRIKYAADMEQLGKTIEELQKDCDALRAAAPAASGVGQ